LIILSKINRLTRGAIDAYPGPSGKFLVMNSDILCNLNFKKFYEEHVKSKNRVSVAICSRESVIDFGVLKYDADHYLTEFHEKRCIILMSAWGLLSQPFGG